MPSGENVLDKLNSGMSYDDVPHYLNLNESTKKSSSRKRKRKCVLCYKNVLTIANICSLHQNHEKLLNVLFQGVSH